MRVSLVLILLWLTCGLRSQVIPYNNLPDWTSTASGHYATGLGLADINGDGWKDLVVANGNDMARQRLVVYYNQGDGTFPVNPDWQSADIDYHGHLACGDLDGDGDIDVVVSVYIGAGGFSSPGKLKIYYNEGGELESNPSFESESFYTFSCALGDADGDGDLDIAVAAGEPYGNLLDKGKIFINTNGTFQPDPEWQSSIDMGALDVEFGDFNRDGLMDVIFVCEGTPNYIYLGSGQGMIETSPAWSSAEPQNYINSVDVGYAAGQSIVVMTENSQLGGDGKVRRYDFLSPFPAASTASWYSNPFGYGSGILLNDVNLDGYLDLIYGGWWLPVKIALGDSTGFELNASYTSSTNSVVEAILMADLGREDMMVAEESFLIQENSHMVILSRQIVEEITQISLNGETLEPGQYCHVPGKPWVSTGLPLQTGDLIELSYTYSLFPDMVITNWDSNKGNYIFYNTLGGTIGIENNGLKANSLRLYPNPANDLVNINLPTLNSNFKMEIYDSQGRKVHAFSETGSKSKIQVSLNGWPSGLYLVIIKGPDTDYKIQFLKY